MRNGLGWYSGGYYYCSKCEMKMMPDDPEEVGRNKRQCAIHVACGRQLRTKPHNCRNSRSGKVKIKRI